MSQENEKLNELEFNLGTVIRAIRKYKGFNQSEAAKLLGLTQSTYSKVERGLVSTSVENWLQFASLLQINFDAPLTSSVSFGSDYGYDYTNSQTTMTLPKKYGLGRNISCTIVGPFLNYLKQYGHGKQVNEFLNSLSIDPDFFIISHNTLNACFLTDLLESIQIGTNSFDINQLMDSTSFKKVISNTSARFTNSEEFIHYFISNSEIFEIIFQYQVTVLDQQKSLTITSRHPTHEQIEPKTLKLIKCLMIGIISKSLKKIDPKRDILLFK